MEFQLLLKKSEDYAKKAGIKLNPNSKIVAGVINGLIRNREKFGQYYCPCRVITGDKEKDKRIICPCAFMPFEIKEFGHCRCRLFVK